MSNTSTTSGEKVSGGTRLDFGTFIPPTGEWTGLSLSRLIKEKGYKAAANAHNAALASEQLREQLVTMEMELHRANAKVAEKATQLVAEREKHEQELHDLTCYLEGNCYSDPDFIKDSPALKAAKQLREQLAAAVEALKEIRSRITPPNDKIRIIDTALAKIGGKL